MPLKPNDMLRKYLKCEIKASDFLLILQYISTNPGVQGAYMPQYPPLHAAPVSLQRLMSTTRSIQLFYILKIIDVFE